MSRRRKLTHTLITLAFWAMSSAMLLILVAWIGSYAQGVGITRERWMLTATEDEIWQTDLRVGSGYISLHYQHQSMPAFIGNFLNAAPYSNNRTQPDGVRWEWEARKSGAVFIA